MFKIICGCVCWVLAGLAVAVFGLYVLVNFTQPHQQFLVPGRLVLEVDAAAVPQPRTGEIPGRPLALWYDYKTEFRGKTYNAAPKPIKDLAVTIRQLAGKPGAEPALRPEQAGAGRGALNASLILDRDGVPPGQPLVPFLPGALSDVQVQKAGETERILVGEFHLPAGAYVLEVKDLPQELVFSVGPRTPSMTTAVFLLMTVAGILGMLGLILVVVGRRQRKRNKQALAAQTE